MANPGPPAHICHPLAVLRENRPLDALLILATLFLDHLNDLSVRESPLHLSVLLLAVLVTQKEEVQGLRSRCPGASNCASPEASCALNSWDAKA